MFDFKETKLTLKFVKKAIAFTFLVQILTCCATTSPFTSIKKGMSKSEVRLHAGHPDDKNVDGEYEYWIYRTFAGFPPIYYKKVMYFKKGTLVQMRSSEAAPPPKKPRKKPKGPSKKSIKITQTNEKFPAPKPTLPCSGKNRFGSYARDGGCNQHGCWPPGGNCNPQGCSRIGKCTTEGCPAPIKSYRCRP